MTAARRRRGLVETKPELNLLEKGVAEEPPPSSEDDDDVPDQKQQFADKLYAKARAHAKALAEALQIPRFATAEAREMREMEWKARDMLGRGWPQADVIEQLEALSRLTKEAGIRIVLERLEKRPAQPRLRRDAKKHEEAKWSNEYIEWLRQHGTDDDVPAAFANDPQHASDILYPDTIDIDSINAAKITPREVKWLVPERIPRGVITLIGGDGGSGKTTIVCGIVAALTREGGRFFDGSINEKPRRVLFISSEDAPELLVAKLMAAKADLSLIEVYRSADGLMFDLERDLEELRRKCIAQKIGVMVFDTLQTFLGERTDANSPAKVKKALWPLAAMLEQTGRTVLAIEHLNKNAKAAAHHRFSGSQAFVNVARAAFLVGRDEDGSNFIGQTKNNYGPLDRSAFRFNVETAEVADGVTASLVTYPEDAKTDRSINEVIERDERVAAGGMHATKRKAAELFLRNFLKDGPRAFKEVLEAAQQVGIAERTLKNAAEFLCVQKEKTGAAGAPWTWRLPTAQEETV